MKHSKFAIRLRGVTNANPQEPVTATEIREAAAALAALGRGDPATVNVTLATQDEGSKTATVSFQREGVATRAASRAKRGLFSNARIAWDDIDTNFLDLTVLEAPDQAEVDICAVHGLNGNAFDTWFHAGGKGNMWLRDALPKGLRDPETNRTIPCRVTLFGYPSALFDKRKAYDRMQDYADRLLRELQLLRQSSGTEKRPLILICHSMGGLVARLAMVRLHNRRREFRGLHTGQFGLLFLSTPHFGSRTADWGNFWLTLGKAVSAREELVKDLKTLNLSIVDVAEIWEEMAQKPVISCLCEADKTRYSRFRGPDVIVPPSSAGFLDAPAEKVLGTDHRTICKFENAQSQGYKRAIFSLNRIRRELVMRAEAQRVARIGDQNNNYRIPGYPPRVPSKSPLPVGRKHYHLGAQGIRSADRFIGRSDVLESIESFFTDDSIASSSRRAACLAGMGGIGKTEISYEIAKRNKGLRSVFMFHASDAKKLETSYVNLVFEIGHDALASRYEGYQEAHTVWASLSQEGRVAAVKRWIESEENAGCIVIFDDIDGLQNIELVEQSIPQVTGRLIYSCRDPTLAASQILRAKVFAIPSMSNDDAAALMRLAMTANDLIAPTPEVGRRIASIACHHPSMMLLSAYFIGHVLAYERMTAPQRSEVSMFSEMFTTGDWGLRRDLLDTEIYGSLSLMQSFKRSLDRLPGAVSPQVLRLVEIISFISPPFGSPSRAPYREFFRDRPWIRETAQVLYMPDYDLLVSRGAARGTFFAAMRKVSLLLAGGTRPGDAFIHPIWLECARHQCQERRRSWIRQLLLVCWLDSTRGHFPQTADTFLKNILGNCRSFAISLHKLNLGSAAQAWVQERSQPRMGDRQLRVEGGSMYD
ncbi:hypothetical protein ACJ41O_000325 [Fusarium nematophilum]